MTDARGGFFPGGDQMFGWVKNNLSTIVLVVVVVVALVHLSKRVPAVARVTGL